MSELVQGLVSVSKASGLTAIVAKRVSPSACKRPGLTLNFADDLDVASDGTVYFSTLTDVPLIPTRTGEYDALKPCVLNVLQVSVNFCCCTADLYACIHDSTAQWCLCLLLGDTNRTMTCLLRPDKHEANLRTSLRYGFAVRFCSECISQASINKNKEDMILRVYSVDGPRDEIREAG